MRKNRNKTLLDAEISLRQMKTKKKEREKKKKDSAKTKKYIN